MKKLLFSLLLSSSFFLANAQSTTPNDDAFGFLPEEVFIEGNLSFSSHNDHNIDIKTTDFSVNPKAGYFITDALAVGLQGNYTLSKYTEQDIKADVESNTYAGGIFARYYFLEIGKRFFSYTEIGGTYGLTETSITDSEGITDNLDGINTINSGLSLGLNYFVNQNIIISFTLSDLVTYNYKMSKADESKPIETITADLNIINNFFQTAKFGVMFLL